VRAAEEIELPHGVDLAELRDALRAAGARFAFLHGSRIDGRHREDSDLDVAALFGRRIGAWEVALPPRCDLLVLDTAGLELAGRVAQRGVLLLDEDPPTRVAWQADHCKRYLDEAERNRHLVATVLGGGPRRAARP
jgi:uncharacterized protein